MNRLQKLAWYQLVFLVLWIAITASAAVIIYYKNLNGELITIPLLLGIFIRFDRVFFPLKSGRIEYDERDEMIKQKAMNLAYGIFWYTFVFGSLITYFIIGPKNYMPTGVFVIMLLGGVILLRLVWSVAVIVLYGTFLKQKSDSDLKNV